jgi:hypothetical protein
MGEYCFSDLSCSGAGFLTRYSDSILEVSMSFTNMLSKWMSDNVRHLFQWGFGQGNSTSVHDVLPVRVVKCEDKLPCESAHGIIG